jgi:hypothetical protein
MKKRNTLLTMLLALAVCMGYSQSATITVDANTNLGTLFRSEKYNNVAGVNTGASTRDADYAFMNSQGLHSKVLRVWVSDGLYDGTTGTYNYSSYYNYLNSVSNLMADEILMCIPGNVLIDSRAYTPAQVKPVVKNIIKHFKNLYPKIKYIEALNEPDLYSNTNITTANLYSYYKVFYEAVNEVNAELLPTVPLQVGGAAISSFKYFSNWISALLDGYRDDVSAGKKLDFISYHTYSYKENPKETSTIRPIIEGWLSGRGLSTTIPSMVTETGLFPGAATSGTEEDDALVQAAGMASYVYWEIGSPYNIPFNWVQRHAAEVRKDQIVTRPNSYSDRLTPYGNSLKMFSMLKAQRITATTNVMDANGLGVYALATKDANGLSVLVWNYQHTATQDYYTNLAISNLSAVFSSAGIRKKVYRIDQRTSNNYYNVSNCNLQLVDDTVIANPGAAVNLSLGVMTENSLQLVILEPASAPAANTYNLGVNRQGNGFLLNWSTNSESNSVYWEVFRSLDGTSFSKIGSVAAAGSSGSLKQYGFTDGTPINGINYYQVKLVSTDSSRTASRVVNAFVNIKNNSTAIYYDFGATGSENGNVTSGVPAGWTASATTRNNAGSTGTVFTSTSPSNTYSGFSAAGNATMGALQGSLNGRTVTYGSAITTIPATPLSALSYYEVILTPTATEQVKIVNMRFGSRSIGSSGGPANVVIRTSIDNFSANAYSQDVNATASWGAVNASFGTELKGAAGVPVTIRIYANDAVGSASANNWRIDDLSITVNYSEPLSQLHTFTVAETAGHDVQLSWQTATEQNVSQFDILRSSDGTTFTSIGQVTATGNSSINRQYGFVDPSPIIGMNYYQVREVFTNASVTLSDVQAIYLAPVDLTSIYYSFGATGSENGNATSGVPAGWTASAVTIANSSRTNTFFTSVSNTGSYTGASQAGNAVLIANTGSLLGRTVTYGSVTTTIPASSLSQLSYFQATLTPSASQAVKITRISFGSRSIGSSGGPANVVIRTSIDNYTSNIFMQDLNANSAWQLITASFGAPVSAGIGQAVTIRIYANDATGSTSVNNWRIDDLNITTELSSGIILPVTLTKFTATSLERTVRLHWRVVSEEDNTGYIIERSADGKAYSALATVRSKSQLSSMSDYVYVDQFPLTGDSYYRLRITGNDGQEKIHGPVRVQSGRSKATAIDRVWITGSSLQLNVVSDKAAPATVALFDIMGRCLATRQTQLSAGTNWLSLPMPPVQGTYLVRVFGEGFTLVKKFVR